jgi:hypothetical protein
MNINVKKVWVDDMAVYVETESGDIYKELFDDYPRLRYATQEQRNNFEYDNIGIHWEDIDEDLSFTGFVHKNDATELELYKIFKQNSEINVSAVARRMNISQSVMAAYICGIKKPSKQRCKEIEKTLHKIGKNLLDIRLLE